MHASVLSRIARAARSCALQAGARQSIFQNARRLPSKSVVAGGLTFGVFTGFVSQYPGDSYTVVEPPRGTNTTYAYADEMPASDVPAPSTTADGAAAPPPPQPLRQSTTRETLSRHLEQESEALEAAVAEARSSRRRQSRDLSFLRMKPKAVPIERKPQKASSPTDSANTKSSPSADASSSEYDGLNADETGKLLDEEARELESAIAEEEEHLKLMFASSCGAQFERMYRCVKGTGSGPDFETDVCKDALAAVTECVQRHPKEFPEFVCASIELIK